MQAIYTDGAPFPIGPYSQAIIEGTTIYTSGQIAIDPETNKLVIEGGIKAQTKQVCENLKAIVEAAGCSLKDIIKTTIYLSDMKDYDHMNEVYKEYFGHKPARTCVEVSRLPGEAMIEIEAIAYK